MEIAIGTIIGLLVAIILFLSGMYLERKGFSISRSLENASREISGKKAKILMPKSDEQEAVEELIQRNEIRGEGTPLNKIRN